MRPNITISKLILYDFHHNHAVVVVSSVPREALCYAMGRTIRTFDENYYKYDVCDNTMLTDENDTISVICKCRSFCE
jgi:hypothetical protein